MGGKATPVLRRLALLPLVASLVSGLAPGTVPAPQRTDVSAPAASPAAAEAASTGCPPAWSHRAPTGARRQEVSYVEAGGRL